VAASQNELYAFIRQAIKPLYLINCSGGTDLCNILVGSSPLLPVYVGEIQVRYFFCVFEF
jgi:hypothetical protein